MIENCEENIIQFQVSSDLNDKLMRHFFASKKNVYLFNGIDLLGVITYESYLKNLNDICNAIKPVNIYQDKSHKVNDDFAMINDWKVLLEYENKDNNLFDIKLRFDDLYKDNDKIINYLRSLPIKRVAIFGSLREMLANHIDMYGAKFDVLIGKTIEDFYNLLDYDTLIIDTDSEMVEFKYEIAKAHNLIYKKNGNKIKSLETLCEDSEYYYFVNNVTTNPNIKVSVLEFPDIYKLNNLSLEEKFRISFDHLYRYYYERYKEDPYIDSILRKVLGELYSDEFILSRNYMPKVYLKGGRCFLENSNNYYCGSQNGKRITTNQDYNNNFNINFFGPCLVFGPLSDDSRTICSYLQRKINDEGYDYQVHNYGARAIGLIENIRSFDAINLFKNDQCIFVVNQKEKSKLKEFGYDDFIDLKPVFEDNTLRDYFIDEPVHCNHIANEKIANYTFLKIKNFLMLKNSENDKLIEQINFPKNKNVFKNNKYLKQYLEFLKNISVTTDNNGCILMNCNPFTFGHYKLIEYASKQVPTLYVFVVEENKSHFSFQDRLEMVKEGCKNFDNVIVIPSGKIFASAMLFPQYFTKEDNPNVEIDVSLDRELFTQYIAPTLNIKRRFVGEENVDLVTRAYNEDIKKNLPFFGIEVSEIPRFQEEDKEISAKEVRRALQNGDWETVYKLVPESTVKVLRKKRLV